MARPRNQASRRAQVIAAATQAVMERGTNGARLRDIAQEAGLSPAAVLYYYPDIEILFTEVFAQGMQTYCERRSQAIQRFSDPWDQLCVCIRSGIPRPGETEDTSRLLYELLPVTLRTTKAHDTQQDFFVRQSTLYQTILESGQAHGRFRLVAAADLLAREFVALEDGYALGILTGHESADQVEQRLLRYATVSTQPVPYQSGTITPQPMAAKPDKNS